MTAHSVIIAHRGDHAGARRRTSSSTVGWNSALDTRSVTDTTAAAGWNSGKNGPDSLSCCWNCSYSGARCGVVDGGGRLLRHRLDLGCGALGPAGAQADESPGAEHEVVLRVRVVRVPQPQAHLLLAGAVVLERGRHRAGNQLDVDADLVEVGLDALGERPEGQPVHGEVARVLQLDGGIGAVAPFEGGLGPVDVANDAPDQEPGPRGTSPGSRPAPGRHLRRRDRAGRRSRAHTRTASTKSGFDVTSDTAASALANRKKIVGDAVSSIVRPSALRSDDSWSLARSITMSALPFCTSIACVVTSLLRSTMRSKFAGVGPT